MQWLIDLIKEWVQAQGYATQSWVQAQGYLTTSFIDRGEAADYDFKTVEFDKDGAWHTLLLSGIIPAGAKAVLLRCTLKNNTIGKLLLLRSHETPSTYNVSPITIQVANNRIQGDMIVHLDADRTIEYLASLGGWTDLFLTVGGWWL